MYDAKQIAELTGVDLDAIELRIIALMEQQRLAFEQWYATHCNEVNPDWMRRNLGLGMTAELVKDMRVGEDYGDKVYLNGCWEGWQGKSRYTGNDPFVGFLLEGANEGELAAYDYGCRSCEVAVRRVIEGDDNGLGATNEPRSTLRNQLLRLKADAERWRKMLRKSFSSPAFSAVAISIPAFTQEGHDKGMNDWIDGIKE